MDIILILTFLLTPTYVVRLNLFGFPTNLLMLWVVFFWIIFLFRLVIKNQLSKFFAFIKTIDVKILAFATLFFLSGIFGLFINGIDRAKLGQFIVLFLQPIITFFIFQYIFSQNSKLKPTILYTLYFILAASGLYAIIQYFTLLGLPIAFWGNSVEPKRAASFFIHPNFYALWSAPLLALLVPDLFGSLNTKAYRLKTLLWLLGAVGLLLSLSRAGWLGLAVAIAVYTFVAADKKIKRAIFASVIVIVIIIVSTPTLRWRFALPFYGEKSAVSRFSLWTTGWKAGKESPVLGLGLNGFSNNWQKLNTDTNLDTHNFPHNIFLDFWVETGLLGLISFIGLVSLFIYRGLTTKEASGQVNLTKLSVALFLICLLAQGQIDNPYFKNDLAIVFWLALALAI